MTRRISGTLDVGSLTVHDGETWVLDGNLEVRASGDIVILGRIVCDSRSARGSGIRLAAQGNVLIAGRIATADGAAGDTPPVSTSVRAGDGFPGGTIEIRCSGFLVILKEAQLEAGCGGSGGGAYAEGVGAAATLVSAISGAGAAGGAIALSAGDLLIVEGEVKAGCGGWGGQATATGRPPPASQPKPKPDDTTNEPDDPPLEVPERPRLVPAAVEATGRAGGPGGNLTLSTTVRGGLIKLRGTLKGGDGGSSCKATAQGGRRATAYLEAGGRGGDVAITLFEAPPGMQDVPGSTIVAGHGGDAGDRTYEIDINEPPPIFFQGAIARGTEAAVAWVGHPQPRGKPAGGAPGDVTAVALWPGPPRLDMSILFTFQQASAGSSTDSIAEVRGKEKPDYGISARGADPGTATKAELP